MTYTRKIPGTNTKAQWTWIVSPTTVNTFQASFSGNVILQGDFLANPVFLTDYTRKGQGITLPMIYGTQRHDSNRQHRRLQRLGRVQRQLEQLQPPVQLQGRLLEADRQSQPQGRHSDHAQPQEPGQLARGERYRQLRDRALQLDGQRLCGDALIGNFSQYTEANTNREGWYRFTQIEPYIQDDWKVNQRLTLNLGLRYQYMQPQFCALQNCVMFLPQYFDPKKAPQVNRSNGRNHRPATGDPYNGLTLGGDGFPEAAKQRIAQTYQSSGARRCSAAFPRTWPTPTRDTWGPRLGLRIRCHRQATDRACAAASACSTNASRATSFSVRSTIRRSFPSPTSTTATSRIRRAAPRQAFPAALSNSHYLDMKVPRVIELEHGQFSTSSTASPRWTSPMSAPARPTCRAP